MKYIKGIDRKQVVLFPESIDEYIENNNPVQFVDVFVDRLDLNELGFKHAKLAATGRPPYNPGDLLKLYVYGYLNRIRSSRWLEKECNRNVELIWLLKKLAPDFKTIADFRKDNRKAIKRVCKEFVFLCKKLDLFGGELIAIDGSKFKAVNSKKRNFNEAKLKRKLKEIEEKIEEYFRDLEKNDNIEADVGSDDAEELKEKIELLKKRGEEYTELLKKLKESGETQISQTDPDSRAMLNNQKIEVSYNVQMSVDEKNKLILDHEVTNEANDIKQLSRMAKRAKKILDVDTIEVLADKGYYNAVEIKKCVDDEIITYIPKPANRVSKKHIFPKPKFYNTEFRYDTEKDVYICPEGGELTFWNTEKNNGKMTRTYRSERCFSCKVKHECTHNKRGKIIYRWEHEEILEEMERRVEKNKDKMKRRQGISEHPFGTIKRAFNQGYMLMKGKDKVGAEMSLTVLAYNIKRTMKILGIKELIAAVAVAAAA